MTDQDRLAAMIATAVGAALAKAMQTRNRKVVAKSQKAPQDKAAMIADRDASIIRGFNAKGIKSADIKLRDNVLPYKLWLQQGRVVRKGQHGVRGLFHVSQTDALPASQPVVVVEQVAAQ